MEIILYTIGTILLILLVTFFRTKNHISTPSPKALPIIGHMHLLRKGLPHQIFQELSKRYGSIFHLRLGGMSTLIISSPTLAKEVLKTQDSTFASRPYFLVAEYCYGFKDIALSPNNGHWSDMRRLCTSELFTSKCLNTFLGLRLEELGYMFTAMLELHGRGQAINVRDIVSTLNFNTITRILMSKKFLRYREDAEHIRDEEAHEFKDILEEIVTQVLQFHIGEMLPPSLRWIDWTIPHLKRLRLRYDKFMQKIIDEHKAQGRSVVDFMDILLQHCPEDTVKAVIMELIQGGTDTSSCAIEWTLAELLHSPHILRKAQDELESLVGNDRMVHENDLHKLDYIQALVKESFRFHPPLSLVPHTATEDCKLAGYVVPRGTTAFVNVYAIGRDPSVWEDPNVFRPERFVGKSVDVKGHDFELLPFGAGRRICPGMALGLKTVQLVVSNLIHGFDWSFEPGKEASHTFEESSGVVVWAKTPLQALITPKLKAEAYKVFL